MTSNTRTPGAALRTGRARLVAALAISAAALTATTGCAMLSTQATTIPYSPADGVNVPDSGPVLVRNALFVADDTGENANFIAAIINNTSESQTLTVEIGDEAPTVETIRVPANTTISLGVTDDPILVEDFGVLPGADVPVYFQSGDTEGVLQAVPVLDGSLDYLAPFVP